jgi:hypothetical protein
MILCQARQNHLATKETNLSQPTATQTPSTERLATFANYREAI